MTLTGLTYGSVSACSRGPLMDQCRRRSKNLLTVPVYFILVHVSEQSWSIELILEENKPEDKLQECT